MPLTPAEYVIKKIGGVRATARAIGREPSTVCKWRKSKKRKGTGGAIPRGNHKRILAFARKSRLDIQPADIIFGR